jgi:2,4-dienoyl-CoA reductase-like NADH-dependent reductase (Old Yellow Enzyme family)
MKNITSALLQPYTLGDLALSNRVVMAPLTRAQYRGPLVPPRRQY